MEKKECYKQTLIKSLGIKYELTAPGTPQQNAVVERFSPTLMGRAGAMMNHALMTRRKIWSEAVSTATTLDNIMVKPTGGKAPYYMFFK